MTRCDHLRVSHRDSRGWRWCAGPVSRTNCAISPGDDDASWYGGRAAGSLTLSNKDSIVSRMYSGSSQVAVASAGEPGDGLLPVLPPLTDLFPHGGLRRGSVVAVPGSGCSAWRLPRVRRRPGRGAGWWGCPSWECGRRPVSAWIPPGCCWSVILGSAGRRWRRPCWMAATWCSSGRPPGRPRMCRGISRPPCAGPGACWW